MDEVEQHGQVRPAMSVVSVFMSIESAELASSTSTTCSTPTPPFDLHTFERVECVTCGNVRNNCDLTSIGILEFEHSYELVLALSVGTASPERRSGTRRDRAAA